MALIFAYLLVGSVIFMLITFAFAGFAWVASGFIFILSVPICFNISFIQRKRG